MNVVLLCGIVLAGAVFAEAASGRELCGLTNDKIKQVLDCMVQHAPPQVRAKALELFGEKGDSIAAIIKAKCQSDVDFVKTKALEVLGEKGDNVAEIIKAKCESEVDFASLISTVFSGRSRARKRSETRRRVPAAPCPSVESLPASNDSRGRRSLQGDDGTMSTAVSRYLRNIRGVHTYVVVLFAAAHPVMSVECSKVVPRAVAARSAFRRRLIAADEGRVRVHFRPKPTPDCHLSHFDF
ncbi:hypothetical protein HPB50_008930 [Hyalomma asiaticum]|uniref:Uncharacterized protein n=1 Tax=Hyalomma asiaticum TaxID=266040 RepID=A0ACB7THE4_HYAAI|nr:hypothetical protein HPB50_008930 [Hyalomma asiaticum]